MPANGTSVRASVISEVFFSSQSAAFGPANSSGKTSRISSIEAENKTANRMPATAAARGVLSLRRTAAISGFIN